MLDIKQVESIETFVLEKVKGSIDICRPSDKSEVDKVHFLLNSKEIISYFAAAEISLFIKKALKLKEVIVRDRSEFEIKELNYLFRDIKSFSAENYAEIKNYIIDNYKLSDVTEKKSEIKNKFDFFIDDTKDERRDIAKNLNSDDVPEKAKRDFFDLVEKYNLSQEQVKRLCTETLAKIDTKIISSRS